MSALPQLGDEYPLSKELIASYQLSGHVLLRGLASAAEIEAFRPVIRTTAMSANVETRPLDERDTYGKAFLQMWNLWEKNADVARFVLAPRFAKVAAELMGVRAARIYHDQALFKEAGGGITPMHQDQHYWPLGSAKATTMWMPLVPITRALGSMRFASGSHSLGYLGDSGISDESGLALEQLVAKHGFKVETYGAMEPGDATFHDGWMLHGAPANPSTSMREVMTIIYIDGDARVSDIAPYQQDDHNSWLPGTNPGDPAATARNPLVYERA